MTSPRHSRSTTTTRLSTRAGDQASSRAYCSPSNCRSAASIAPGVVSCSVHMPPASVTRAPSDRSPAVPRLEQRVGRLWPGRAGGVLHQLRVTLAPRLDNRVDHAPLRLDLVVAREKGAVAPHPV